VSSSRQSKRGGPQAWRLEEVLATPHRKSNNTLSWAVTQGPGRAVVNTAMNLRVPLNLGNFLTC